MTSPMSCPPPTTDPVAPAPRALNPIRHGLTSPREILPWESAEARARLLDELRAEHAPRGPTESHLVEELAEIVWRRRRLHRAEEAACLARLRELTADLAGPAAEVRSAWLATPLLGVSTVGHVAPSA